MDTAGVIDLAQQALLVTMLISLPLFVRLR